MRIKIAFLCLIVFGLAAAASAQTKISGTAQCGKRDPQYAIPTGHRATHSFAISQSKCPYTKPSDIAGIQTKEFVATNFSEINGSRATTLGFVEGTMANGDRFQVRSQGSSTTKEGGVESAEGTWSFVGGTGKLKGIKGKGTYKGEGGPEGITYEIEGEYELPK
jgi:hypothetical protein